jgi:hypothetical protein
MNRLSAAFLAVVACIISTAFAQDSEPTKQEIEATKAAILKEGPQVPYETYRKVVPAYASRSGKLTDKGSSALSESSATPSPAPSPSPEPTPTKPVPSNLPEKSSLKIKETVWTEDFKTDPEEAKESQRLLQLQNPGMEISVSTKCRGVHHKFLFTPTVSLGKDTGAGEPKLNFWVIKEFKVGDTRKKEGRLTKPRTHSGAPAAATGDITKPVEHIYTEWKCSCCRSMKDGLLGWYAELRAGDQVLATAKSALDSKAQKAIDEFLHAGAEPESR